MFCICVQNLVFLNARLIKFSFVENYRCNVMTCTLQFIFWLWMNWNDYVWFLLKCIRCILILYRNVQGGTLNKECWKRKRKKLNWNESVYFIIGSNFRSCHILYGASECKWRDHCLLCMCVKRMMTAFCHTNIVNPEVCSYEIKKT